MRDDNAWDLLPEGLLDRPGPYLSLYLDTRVDSEGGAKTLDLRWRALRQEAVEAGAPEELLVQLDGIVDGVHTRGDGIAVLGAGSEVVLRRHLSSSIEDAIRFGDFLHLLPWVEYHQENPTHAVVLVDRIGAEIHLISAFLDHREIEVEGIEDQISKVHAGGWAHRRFHQHAENLWEQNAERVAEVVSGVAAMSSVQLVVVSGDVRAVGFLKEHIREEVAPRLFELEGVQAQSLDEISEEVRKVVTAHMAQTTEEILQTFQEERGQKDRAVEGWGNTAEALSQGQIETLLVGAGLADRPAFALREDRRLIDVDRAAIEALGAGEVIEGPADDVVVTSALASAASVRLIPRLGTEHAPRDGIGGILRYASTGMQDRQRNRGE